MLPNRLSFTMGGLFKKSFRLVRKRNWLVPFRPPIYQCVNCKEHFTGKAAATSHMLSGTDTGMRL